MNLSRNKLSKIANTKYQSRKNRPSKKKNAGASKIRTKFTKKRKIGGKGKNLRKNTMKQKIQFNKKGGDPDGGKNPAPAPEPGPEKVTTDGTQTEPELEKITTDGTQTEPEPELATTEAEEETAATTEQTKPSDTYCKTGDLEVDEKYNQNLHNYGSTPEERCSMHYPDKYSAQQSTQAAPGPVAQAPAPGPGPVAPGQASNEQTGDNRFKVTLDMLVDNRGNIQLLGAESTKTGKIDTSGVSTIVTLDQSKTTSDSDIKNKPVDDMLKQIVEMLNEMKKQ